GLFSSPLTPPVLRSRAACANGSDSTNTNPLAAIAPRSLLTADSPPLPVKPSACTPPCTAAALPWLPLPPPLKISPRYFLFPPSIPYSPSTLNYWRVSVSFILAERGSVLAGAMISSTSCLGQAIG